ncbi:MULTISPECIES: 4-hydroxy-3-methylbut-2-enyl diphosphate reductase [Cetobacterium]|uniref:4-hydroxy-3-methylbut-2-enyl diphosphate reductase n=1 Tax=Candidatus Cetobacterium colombiensis TaxID=3073100 RepID=A0ABU4WA86_9FUSO|nr:4-hydroxy-3-methylbut-2-enyl diphosphate reductase [Candidatus Cetobacterium colombiensis]MDX8336453.1 4-hydroxy-3-methylbut-2-enyl diphosphate reductase [Candidatus Cetobacterium colombiensis]
MEIVRAEKMGFCFGVKKAVETCYKISNYKDKKKYILGMVVHNKDVVREMENIGFVTVNEEDILNGKDSLKKGDIIIIRAHGTTSQIVEILKNKEVEIYDATCIFVDKIKEILLEQEALGDEIIFIGDKEHPEVKGIISFGKKVKVFKNLKELKENPVDSSKEYSVLTQTTLNKSKFLEIKEYLEKNYSKAKIFDRICGATSERQEATKKLAKECDIVIVIGDLKSSNSKKLLEVALAENLKSYLVQNETELDLSIFSKNMKVGITAGASTPEDIIKKIENKIRGNFDV